METSFAAAAVLLFLVVDPLGNIPLFSGILNRYSIRKRRRIIVRETMPAREAGARVGFVIMATIVGMALGGWMSGWIYDVSGSYQLAFVNGIAWNMMNIVVILVILLRSRPGRSTGGLVPA